MCPRCERPFANRKQPHSFGRHSVAEHLRGKNRQTIALYRKFEKMVKHCGPIAIVPAKTRIGFQARMIFASVNQLDNCRLATQVVLARRLEHPRFARMESLSPRNHVDHFQIRALEELDDEVPAWLCEAYAVGEQKHLASKGQT